MKFRIPFIAACILVFACVTSCKKEQGGAGSGAGPKTPAGAVGGGGGSGPIKAIGGPVRSIAVWPDGKTIATIAGAFERNVEVWDLDTRARSQHLVMPGRDAPVGALLADGRTLALSNGFALERWDTAGGGMTGSTPAGQGEGGLTSVVRSPDGKWLASSGTDGVVRLWSGDGSGTAKVIHSAGKKENVRGLSFAADSGRLAASGAPEGTIHIFDTTSGDVLKRIELEDARFEATAWSPDGKHIAAGGNGGRLFLFNYEYPKPHRVIATGADIQALLFVDEGRKLISAGWDRTLRIWQMPAGEPHGPPIFGHQERIYSLAVTPDGKRILSGDGTGAVHIWPLADLLSYPEKFRITGDEQDNFMAHTRGGPTSLAVTPDGNTLFTNAYDGAVGVWDLKTHKRLHAIKHVTGSALPCAISPDGKLVAYGEGISDVRVIRLADGVEVAKFKCDGFVVDVAFMDDSKTVIAAGGKRITAWHIEKKAEAFGFPAEAEELEAMVLLPGGRQLATGGKEMMVKLWDLPGGKLVKWFQPDIDKILSIRCTPDGKRLVSHTIWGKLRVWDVETGKQTREVDPKSGRVDGMAILPDGKTLAYPRLREIVLVDIDSGVEKRVLKGHMDNIADVICTKDGRRLISGSSDGTVKVWNVP